MKNPLYDGDPTRWNELNLADKIEAIRQHLCTGPSGQSSQAQSQRHRINAALREVLGILGMLNAERQ